MQQIINWIPLIMYWNFCKNVILCYLHIVFVGELGIFNFMLMNQ